MIYDINRMEITDINKKYIELIRGSLTCYYRGFFYCSGKRAGEESIEVLLNQYLKADCIDFTGFYGSYHIMLVDKQNNKTIVFTDNAGSCCFYYDKEKGVFSDSFLELTAASGTIKPNYNAITQFIHFDCIYGENTICEGIIRTTATDYYVCENSIIVVKDKNLLIWNSDIKYLDMHSFMEDAVYAARGLKAFEVITGGMDSRTVLSHLISLGAEVELVISGREEMVDVRIAKEISERLGKDIHISNEEVYDDDKDWLRSVFIRCDGVSGTFSRYRLHKKYTMLENLGAQLEFGGVSGELHKNSFINQDFPFYNAGKADKRRFYEMKINPSKFGPELLTPNIISYLGNMEEKVTETVFDKVDDEKSKVYFRAGSRILRDRMITLTNSNSLSVPTMFPLAEIDIMKLSYNKNAWDLELYKWHRNEVSRYCPEIASIKTDRGATLSNNKATIYSEAISSYLFLFKMGLSRTIFRKMQKNSPVVLDAFIKGRKLKEFANAMDMCKELNILNPNCIIDDIPDNLADRLMTIGLTFMKYI